jgi:hypothetical protein
MVSYGQWLFEMLGYDSVVNTLLLLVVDDAMDVISSYCFGHHIYQPNILRWVQDTGTWLKPRRSRKPSCLHQHGSREGTTRPRNVIDREPAK